MLKQKIIFCEDGDTDPVIILIHQTMLRLKKYVNIILLIAIHCRRNITRSPNRIIIRSNGNTLGSRLY